jgi:DNA-binding transcriptional regulator GbsR (MarR family)
MKLMKVEAELLEKSRQEFVAQWGALGTQWGINRTMAQIHALLMTSAQALSTDDVMEAIAVSRGNAHANLKELVNWGLVRMFVIKGERRDFYEAEKDVWQIFTIIARERKRREIEPALALLNKCAEETKDLGGAEAKEFYNQMRQLEEFVSFASKMSDRISTMRHGFAMQLATKIFG